MLTYAAIGVWILLLIAFYLYGRLNFGFPYGMFLLLCIISYISTWFLYRNAFNESPGLQNLTFHLMAALVSWVIILTIMAFSGLGGFLSGIWRRVSESNGQYAVRGRYPTDNPPPPDNTGLALLMLVFSVSAALLAGGIFTIRSIIYEIFPYTWLITK